MPVQPKAANLVYQLSLVGLRPDKALVHDILACGDAARAPLLNLATTIEALHTSMPASLGPLHALRLLGELPDVAMIEPLFAKLPVPVYDPEHDVAARLYATELPQIVGRVGAPAVVLLWAIADDPARSDAARGAALSTLPFVAAFAPEVRAELLNEARRRLASPEQQIVLTTGVVAMLADLGDAASYKAVIKAYRAGQVDQKQAPAASARQFLLGGGRSDLGCVAHSLWERYEHHGPAYRIPADALDND